MVTGICERGVGDSSGIIAVVFVDAIVILLGVVNVLLLASTVVQLIVVAGYAAIVRRLVPFRDVLGSSSCNILFEQLVDHFYMLLQLCIRTSNNWVERVSGSLDVVLAGG